MAKEKWRIKGTGSHHFRVEPPPPDALRCRLTKAMLSLTLFCGRGCIVQSLINHRQVIDEALSFIES
jgi:hypothetical protein